MFEWGEKTVYLDHKVKNIRQVWKKHYLTIKTNADNKNEQFSEENRFFLHLFSFELCKQLI